MKLKIFKSAALGFLFLVVAWTSPPAYGNTQSNIYVTAGRVALFSDVLTYGGLVTANASFRQAVAADATDMTAHLFYSFTRLAAFGLTQGTGGDPTLRDLLEAFGTIYNLDTTTDLGPPFQSPATYPDTAPTADEVVAFLTGPFTAEIDAIISEDLDVILAAGGDLSTHHADFLTQLTMAETGELYDTDVDYGDVLSYKAALQMLKAMIQVIATYDTANLDIDQLLNAVTIDINTDLLDAYQEFLTLLPTSSTTIASAKNSLLAAITTFNGAIDFIEAETDDQLNDFITLDEDGGDLEEVQYLLAKTEESLTSGQPVDVGYIEEQWRIVDGQGRVAEMWIDREMDNTFNDGDYWSMNGDQFLAGGGWVDGFSIDGSTATILLSNNWDWDCPFSATLTGTISGDGMSITAGSYTYTYTGNTCSPPGSGTFSATQTGYYEESLLVDLNEFFNADEPLILRDYLPTVDQDPYNDEVFITAMPADRTLSGFFPDGLPLEDGEGIDRVFVWGGHSANGPFTNFTCFVNGLAPWNIESLTVYGPYDTTVNFDLANSLTHHYQHGTLYATSAGPLPEGLYTFELLDDEGRRYYEEKYYTSNLLAKVDMTGGISPASQAYTNSTTPTFSWQGVTNDLIAPLYYRLRIMDWNKKMIIYDSELSTVTSATVPQGFLEPDQAYKWQVQVFDSATTLAANNFSVSDWRSFATGDAAAPLAIDKAFVRTRLIPEADFEKTQFGIKLKGPAPFAGSTITIKNPAGSVFYTFTTEDLHPNGLYIHHEDGIVADGTYTFTVLDGRNNTTEVTADRSLAAAPLPAPFPLGINYEGFLQTITPTLTWTPVVGTVAPLYYRVKIMDYNFNLIYESDYLEDTYSLQLPAGILKVNSPYLWKVEVYDAASGANNLAESPRRPFFVEADGPTATIAGQVSVAPEIGYQSGDMLYIGVFDSQQALEDGVTDGLYSFTALDDTGVFTIYNLPLDTQLYIGGRWDADNNGALTTGDWRGAYSANPLVLNTADTTTTGIDLTINTRFEASSPLVGSAGLVELTHTYDGYSHAWLTMAGRIVFNNDGTGSLDLQRNDNGSTWQGQTNFEYLVEDNNDGSLTAWLSDGYNPSRPTRMVVADNGTMAITDGTTHTEMPPGHAQKTSLSITLDPAREYANSDLYGDYYLIGYEFDASYSEYISFSAILTADGAGGYGDLSQLTVNNYNNVASGSDPGGTYAVNPDGSFNLDGGGLGFIGADGAIAAFTNPDNADAFSSYFLMKRGDRPYSTPDLAGTWALAGFGDESGDQFTADFGTMTCDAAGNCMLAMRSQTNDTTEFWSGTAAQDGSPLQVATDGSFGASAVQGYPFYAGAIGNDGHTVILNTSFGPDPNRRHIFIGVRKESAVNLAGVPYGDVNGDGLVGMADAIQALQVLVNLHSGPFNSLADVDEDQKIGLAEAIYIMQNLAGHRGHTDPPPEPAIYTANGTYTYVPGSPGSLTANTTFSTFACEGFEVGTEQMAVVELTETTFTWEEPDGYRNTWTRETGTAGDLVGTWLMTHAPNAWELTINGDNTFTLTGYILDCGDYGPYEESEVYSVWSGTSRTMSAAAMDDSMVLHFHIWAPQYEVTQVTVDGPSLPSPSLFLPCDLETKNDIVVDDFCSTEIQGNAGGYPVTIAPQVGDTYTFTVTRANSSQETIFQTLGNVMLEAPQVTSPTGHTLNDANLDGTLNATWTTPAGVTADEIILTGTVCTASYDCVYVNGTVDSATSGFINLPATINTVPVASVNIDVRVHHGNDVFTNCFYEFE